MAHTPRTAQQYKDAYARMTGEQQELTDAQANALAAQDAADHSGTFFANWTFQVATSPDVQHTTGAVAKIWQVIVGTVPNDAAELNQQVETMINQINAAQARTNDPNGAITIAYKAMGASLANWTGSAVAVNYGQNTDTLLGQQAFVASALQAVFGVAPTPEQIAVNVAVFQQVKAYYEATPVAEVTIDARAKGEFLADLIKQVQDMSPPATNQNPYVQAEIAFIQALGEDTAIFGASLFDQPGAVPPGAALAFTTDLDNLVGTAGDDVFSAPLAGPGDNPVRTLQSFDVADGGGGTDTLNAVLRNTGVSGINPTLTNIEIFNLTTIDGAINRLDASRVTGVEQIWNVNSTANLGVLNLQNEVVVGLQNVAGGTIFRVEYDVNVETQQLVLRGAGNANNAVELRIESNTDLETLNIDAAGVNNIFLSGTESDLGDLVNLNIVGSGTLLMESANDFANIESVDASTFGGALELDLSAVTGGDLDADRSLSVLTGAGDDRVTLAASVFEGGNDEFVTVDLGAGFNTLALSGPYAAAPSFADANIQNVQNLAFTDNITFVPGGDLDFEGLDDLTTLTFEGTVVGAPGMVSLANAPATLTVVFEQGANLAATTFDFEDLVTLTIEADASVEFDAITGASLTTLNLVGDDDMVDFTFGLVDTEALTTINLAAVDGDVTINASGADFGGAANVVVTILVGEGDVNYTTSANTDREIFRFVGDDIGDINITNFVAGAAGGTDRIDFTAFANVTSLDDLVVTTDGNDTFINAFDDEFAGTITLVGVNNVAAVEQSILV
jgi:hypothetical protein